MLTVELDGDNPVSWEYTPPPTVGTPAGAAA